MILWLSKITDTEKWALGFVALLMIGFFTHWFSHVLAIKRERKSSLRAASIKFSSAVLSTLSGLYPIPSDWPRNATAIQEVLRAKFPTMQAAAAEFRPHLPALKRWRFDRAWRLYHLGEDGRDIDQQDYWQYVPYSGFGTEKGKNISHDNTLAYKDQFKNNVARLLSFSKETYYNRVAGGV